MENICCSHFVRTELIQFCHHIVALKTYRMKEVRDRVSLLECYAIIYYEMSDCECCRKLTVRDDRAVSQIYRLLLYI